MILRNCSAIAPANIDHIAGPQLQRDRTARCDRIGQHDTPAPRTRAAITALNPTGPPPMTSSVSPCISSA
jgi:hypothetical protein